MSPPKIADFSNLVGKKPNLVSANLANLGAGFPSGAARHNATLPTLAAMALHFCSLAGSGCEAPSAAISDETESESESASEVESDSQASTSDTDETETAEENSDGDSTTEDSISTEDSTENSTGEDDSECSAGPQDVLIMHRGWVHSLDSVHQIDLPSMAEHPDFPPKLHAIYWLEPDGSWSSVPIESISAQCSVARDVKAETFWVVRDERDSTTTARAVELKKESTRLVDFDRHFYGGPEAIPYLPRADVKTFGSMQLEWNMDRSFISLSCPNSGFRASTRPYDGLAWLSRHSDLRDVSVKPRMQLLAAKEDLGSC
jgi:hypothetical protein